MSHLWAWKRIVKPMGRSRDPGPVMEHKKEQPESGPDPNTGCDGRGGGTGQRQMGIETATRTLSGPSCIYMESRAFQSK